MQVHQAKKFLAFFCLLNRIVAVKVSDTTGAT